MANTNTPRGFVPVRAVTGQPYDGALSTYRILPAYATAIYQGDVVKFLTTGYINKAAANDQMRGVFIGCQYVQADGTVKSLNYYPGSVTTLGSQPVNAFVVDDPNMMFEAQFTNSTSVPAIADLGASFQNYDAGGSTFTGLSGMGLDYSTLNTTLQQWRVVDFVPRGDNDLTSAYSRALCTPLSHDYRTQLAI